MNVAKILLTLAVLVAAQGVRADWDPGDPHKMHHPQTPDLNTGVDILDGPYYVGGPAAYEKFLADDFRCMESGPITGIHIWSSYLGDNNAVLPVPHRFNLAIYDNIPAGTGGVTYSRPGGLRWQAYVEADAERVYARDVLEDFYDPNQDDVIGNDTMVWQYNFSFDGADAFPQTAGKIYWLGVGHSFEFNGDGTVDVSDRIVLNNVSPWAYGWKTTDHPWEDKAVWCDIDSSFTNGEVVGDGPWEPLNWDLAFVIVPEPGTIALLGLGGALALIRRRRR